MIFTFYSYKGGVGRTMAVANVAELLYQKGLKVLMVDFDLEAPGLERFFDVPEAFYKPNEVIEERGVIDLLLSYKELYPSPNWKSENNSKDIEPITNFIVPLYEENEQGGSLFIIPAGCRGENKFSAYAQKVHSFDWNDFYDNYNGEEFFEWFTKEVVNFADVVLIDSRTGVTEMGGVCTYQLADVVIMFVAPNDQNIDGTLKMAQSLSNSELIEKGRKGRELSLVIVPSRVDNSEKVLLDNFQEEFEQKLTPYISNKLQFEQSAFVDLKVPYVPFYAFKEKVAVRESKKASASDLSQAFENLVNTMSIFDEKLAECLKGIPYIPISEEKLKEMSHIDRDGFLNLLLKNLEEYLKNKRWKEADQETNKIMLYMANRENEGWLEIENIDRFPSEDLRTIDQLWVKYSHGTFGFSIQKEIYLNFGGTKEYKEDVWEKFAQQVGWRQGVKWLNYNDLNFELKMEYIPKALLPAFWCLGAWGAGYGGKSGIGVSLLSRTDL